MSKKVWHWLKTRRKVRQNVQHWITTNRKRVLIIVPSFLIIIAILLFVIAPLLDVNFERKELSSTRKWDKGHDSLREAPLAIEIHLHSVEYRNVPTFVVNYTFSARGVRIGEPIQFELRSGTETSVKISLNASKIELALLIFGRGDLFPWDAYIVSIEVEGFDEFANYSEDDIGIALSTSDADWGISYLSVSLTSRLTLFFQINRHRLAVLNELIIPLIILAFLATTTFFADPLHELNAPPRKNQESDPEKLEEASPFAEAQRKIAEKKKFRIDTAKWILLFGFANLIFTQNDLGLTVVSRLALITIGLCGVYYFSSLSQGHSSGAWVTYGIGVVALELLVLITVCSLYIASWL